MLKSLTRTAKAVPAPFAVPSLADASPEYAALIVKQAEVRAEQSTLVDERRRLQAEIAADNSPEIRPAVAELLGDEPSSKALKRRRVAEISTRLKDVDAALEALRLRIGDARGKASRAVCDAVRTEYGRRVAAICDALRTVDEAHRAYVNLRDELEREDVSWNGPLEPMNPLFLGDVLDKDRRITRYLREASAAGYWQEPGR